MYLETGLGQAFKPRSRYKTPRLYSVTVHWNLEVPFRKDFEAFRQELSKAIRPLVKAEADKTEIDRLLLKVKAIESGLREVHVRLLRRRSPKLKESNPVGIDADIHFDKTDNTDVSGISVLDK